MIGKVIDFNFPTMEELGRIGRNERLNLFRRYFSASRYDRLLIQQQLVRSTYDESLISKVKELENLHDQDFIVLTIGNDLGVTATCILLPFILL